MIDFQKFQEFVFEFRNLFQRQIFNNPCVPQYKIAICFSTGIGVYFVELIDEYFFALYR